MDTRNTTNSNSTYYKLFNLFPSWSATTQKDVVYQQDLAVPTAKKIRLTPEEALKAAREAPPRVYKMINHSDQLRIAWFGCGGALGEMPKKVAAFMDDIINKNPEKKPDMIVILGDNAYENGFTSPNDPRIKTQFYDIYRNPNLTSIAGIPCWIVLGNHDLALCRWEEFKNNNIDPYVRPCVDKMRNMMNWSKLPSPLHGMEAGLQQVAISYMDHECDPFIKDKREYYALEALDLANSPKWNMPSDFYAHEFTNATVQIFYINSSTYAKDFFELLRKTCLHEKIDPVTNQAAWIKLQYDIAAQAGKLIFFAQHHPLYTCGPRAYEYKWDANLYLEPQEIKMLNRILEFNPDAPDFLEKVRAVFEGKDEYVKSMKDNANYNQMLRDIYNKFQKIFPYLVMNAHDHSIYYYNDVKVAEQGKALRQLTSGGGGGHTQSLQAFGRFGNLGTFIHDHGVIFTQWDKKRPDEVLIDIYSLKNHHLVFSSRSAKPIREISKDEKVELFRKIILSACTAYQDFLDSKQTEFKGTFLQLTSNVTHTEYSVDCMLNIINSLNKPKPSDFFTTIKEVYKNLNAKKTSTHSLTTLINEAFANVLALSIRQSINKENSSHLDNSKLITMIIQSPVVRQHVDLYVVLLNNIPNEFRLGLLTKVNLALTNTLGKNITLNDLHQNIDYANDTKQKSDSEKNNILDDFLHDISFIYDTPSESNSNCSHRPS